MAMSGSTPASKLLHTGVGCPAACRPSGESVFGRLLAEAEAQVRTAEGAAALWEDKARLTAVLELLKRPASGSAYTQWASSSVLRRAARV